MTSKISLSIIALFRSTSVSNEFLISHKKLLFYVTTEISFLKSFNCIFHNVKLKWVSLLNVKRVGDKKRKKNFRFIDLRFFFKMDFKKVQKDWMDISLQSTRNQWFFDLIFEIGTHEIKRSLLKKCEKIIDFKFGHEHE